MNDMIRRQARFRWPSFVLACLVSGLSLAADDAPWWRSYHTIVSSSFQKEGREWELGMMAERGSWSTGWYGAWWLQHQLERRERWNPIGRVERYRARGVKNVCYFDAGEHGEFVAVIADRRLILNQWELPFYRGEKGALMWFGINGFYSDSTALPLDLKNYKQMGLPSWTLPDGKRPATLYDLAATSFEGKRDRWDHSGVRVPPQVAQALKLDEFLQSNFEPPPAGSGPGRIVTFDHSNPFLLRDFQTNVALMLTQRPAFLHFDNFADNELLYPQWSAFGPWSLEHFKRFLKERLTEVQRRELGIGDPDSFDLRQYIANKPFRSRGHRWHFSNPEWQDDRIWNLFVCSKLHDSQRLYRGLYDFCKEESRRHGSEVVVTGNVIPIFPGGSLVREKLDVAHFEHHITGQYGPVTVPPGLPPRGKLGGVVRLAAAISKVGWCWPTVYVPKSFSGSGHENLHKVLAFDCLSNKGVLDYNFQYLDGYSPGSDDSSGFVNCFIKNYSSYYGSRTALADVGLVFPGQSLLGSIAIFTMDSNRSLYDYLGWAQAMTELHVQWDVLLDNKLTSSSLSKYRAVVLASAECLSDEAVSALRDYVRAGGHLIVSGRIGTRLGPEKLLWKREPAPVLDGAIRTDAPGRAYYRDTREAGRVDGLSQIKQSLAEALPISSRSVETEASANVGVCVFAESSGSLAVDLVNYNVNPATDGLTPSKPFMLKIRPPAGRRFQANAPTRIAPDLRTRIPDATPKSSPTPWDYRREPMADWKLGDDGVMEIVVPSFETFTTVSAKTQ